MKKCVSFILVLCLILASVMPAAAAEYGVKRKALERKVSDGIESEIQIGDVDMDGCVSIKDATLIQKFSIGLMDLDEHQLYVADVDDSGCVNVKDATMVQKKLAFMIDEFPKEVGKGEEKEDVTTPDETIPEETTPTQTAPETSETPTEAPTEAPTEEPTEAPTELPTEEPTEAPTELPTEEPTEVPTEVPTEPEIEVPTLSDMELYAPVDIYEDDFVTSEMLWVIEQEFLRLVNEERLNLEWDCDTVVHNKALDDGAQKRSEEIKVLYDHTRPNGNSCFSAISNYNPKSLGEIIWYFLTGEFTGAEEELLAIARRAFEGFKASQPHYEIMIFEGAEDVGIGLSYELKYGGIVIYISCFFGAQW